MFAIYHIGHPRVMRPTLKRSECSGRVQIPHMRKLSIFSEFSTFQVYRSVPRKLNNVKPHLYYVCTKPSSKMLGYATPRKIPVCKTVHSSLN